MPRVPTLQGPQIEPTRGPAIRATTDPVNLGEGIAGGLANAADYAARIKQDEVRRVNEAASLGFLADVTRFETEQSALFKSREGAAAAGATVAAMEAWDSFEEDYAQKATNPEQQVALRGLMIRGRERLRSELVGHESVQRKVADRQNLDGVRAASIERALQNPAAMEDEIAALSTAIADYGARNSIDPAAVKADQFATTAKILENRVLNGLSQGDDAGAGQFYRQNIDRFDADSRIRIEGMLHTAAERRKAEAAASAALLNEQVQDTLDRVSMGLLPGGLGALEAQVAALPKETALKANMMESIAAVKGLTGGQTPFLTLPPLAQRNQVSAWRRELMTLGPAASDAQVELVRRAAEIAERTEKMAKDDPARFAHERGVAPLLPLDPSFSVESLAARATAARVGTQYLGGLQKSPGLTTQELGAIAEEMGKANATTKMAIIGNVTEAYGQEMAGIVFRELDKKNGTNFGFIGALAMDDENAARMAAQGMDARKNMPSLMPGLNDTFIPNMAASLGDAYGPGTEARRAAEEAIMNVYAAMAVTEGATNGATDGLDSRRLTRAIEAVTGGLVMHNGHKMPAPARGVTQGDFNDWIRGLTAADFSSVAGVSSERASAAVKSGQWRLVGSSRGGYNIVTADVAGDPLYLMGNDGRRLEIVYGKRANTAPVEFPREVWAP